LRPEKPWNWQSINICCDDGKFAVHYEDHADKHGWYQPDGLRATQQLPTILFVPTLLAQFLVEEQRTPWDLFSEVQRLVALPEGPIGAEDAELVKLWAMGAAHSADGSRSLLSMELEPVLSFDPIFLEWTQARLTGTLGALQTAPTQPHPAPAAASTEQRALESISL
jgi:hypothetical protein